MRECSNHEKVHAVEKEIGHNWLREIREKAEI